jgi:hypothetical protein
MWGGGFYKWRVDLFFSLVEDPVVLLFPNFFLDKKVTKSQEKSKCSAAFSGPAPLKHSDTFYQYIGHGRLYNCWLCLVLVDGLNYDTTGNSLTVLIVGPA